MILTLGLALILQGLTVYQWGAEPDRFPFPLSDTAVFQVGPVFVSELSLGTLAAAAAASLVLYLLTQKTRLGLAMRATSENLQAAQTLGIPTRGVLAFAWGAAAALAVVAGVFLAPVLLLDPFFMLDAMFSKGLAAAVLGGLNSLPGAVLGGLLLGVAEALGGAYVSLEFKTSLAFILIVAVLLVRPEGLLGKEFQERVLRARTCRASEAVAEGPRWLEISPASAAASGLRRQERRPWACAAASWPRGRIGSGGCGSLGRPSWRKGSDCNTSPPSRPPRRLA